MMLRASGHACARGRGEGRHHVFAVGWGGMMCAYAWCSFGMRIVHGLTQSLARARLGLLCVGLLGSSAAPPPRRQSPPPPQQKSSAFLKGEIFTGARFYFATVRSRRHGPIASSTFLEAHLASGFCVCMPTNICWRVLVFLSGVAHVAQ